MTADGAITGLGSLSASSPMAAARTVDSPDDVGVFRSVLGRAVRQGDQERQVREAAEELVSIALIQPILAEMRASNNAAPPFAPGPYEKQFGSLMDAEVSRRLVKAQNFPLVDRLARDLLRVSQTTEGSSDDAGQGQSKDQDSAGTERA